MKKRENKLLATNVCSILAPENEGSLGEWEGRGGRNTG